ncbi:MAG: OadG family protein [Bacillota bacterium]
MDNLMLGLKVAAIGIVGVFVVLCVLMGAIKAFEYLIAFATAKINAKKEASAPKVAQAPAPVAVSAPAVVEEDSEVVAVITAAIMAILQGENAGDMPSFTIRKIKQIKRN